MGITEMMAALTKPKKATFPVAYEIFASTSRKEIAYLENKIETYKAMSPFAFVYKPEKHSLEDAELRKRQTIESFQENAPKPEELLDSLKDDLNTHIQLKSYFEAEIKRLGLDSPLIFFDDDALRIDIGYGPKEFDAIFPDFLADYGVFMQVLNSNTSIFQKSPSVLFTPDYLQKDYLSALQKEKQHFNDMAINEFNKPLPLKNRPTLAEGSSETTLVKNLLENHKGLVIGEVHEDVSPKQFLIDRMPALKKEGVTILYMEHLLHERHQLLLDQYLQSPPNEPMPTVLKLYLQHLDNERKLKGEATFTAVVETAKENGIRVIAIDSEATYQVGSIKTITDFYQNSRAERCSIMNIAMLERYAQYNDDKKYVVFTGSAHATTCDGIPGVSELLGSPSLVIRDLDKDNPTEKIASIVAITGKTSTITPDYIYHRNSETKIPKIGATPDKVEFVAFKKAFFATYDNAENKEPLVDMKLKLLSQKITTMTQVIEYYNAQPNSTPSQLIKDLSNTLKEPDQTTSLQRK